MLTFLGASRQKMDDRGRFHLPVRWTEQVEAAGEMVLTAGPNGSLLLLDRSTWEETAARIGTDLLAGQRRRWLRELFIGHAEPVHADKNQRIQIADALRGYAGLKDLNAVFLLGTGNAIEIWSQAKWDEEAATALAAGQLFELRDDPGS
jgi:division/cell wall cluster transcriptional repressor MraZ